MIRQRTAAWGSDPGWARGRPIAGRATCACSRRSSQSWPKSDRRSESQDRFLPMLAVPTSHLHWSLCGSTELIRILAVEDWDQLQWNRRLYLEPPPLSCIINARLGSQDRVPFSVTLPVQIVKVTLIITYAGSHRINLLHTWLSNSGRSAGWMVSRLYHRNSIS